MELVTVKQVHRKDIILIDSIPRSEMTADGMMTDRKGILLGVKTADCVPVLLARKDGMVVSALHCGWRSTSLGIIETCIDKFERFYGTSPENLVVAVGLGIRQCCFEVGSDLVSDFTNKGYDLEKLLVEAKKPEKKMFDLHGLIRKILLEAGVSDDNIEEIGLCTCCNPELFHSYRRDGEKAGRMLSLIGIYSSA